MLSTVTVLCLQVVRWYKHEIHCSLFQPIKKWHYSYTRVTITKPLAGVPEACRYYLLMGTLKVRCKGSMAKIGYSLQGLVAKVKDTIANGYLGPEVTYSRLVWTDGPHVRAAGEFKGRDDLWSNAPLEDTQCPVLPVAWARDQLQLWISTSTRKLLLWVIHAHVCVRKKRTSSGLDQW